MSENIWKIFEGILTPSSRSVGEVVSSTDGVCVIRAFDGSTYRAKGSMEAGKRVFAEDGYIKGEAPVLPYSEVWV